MKNNVPLANNLAVGLLALTPPAFVYGQAAGGDAGSSGTGGNRLRHQ